MFIAVILAIMVAMTLALIRALMGPTAYDRMLAVSMFGTKTVLLIAVAGYVGGWTAFLDIALLYAMISFIGSIAVMRFFEYQAPGPDGEVGGEGGD